MPKTIRDNLKYNCGRCIKHLLTSAEYVIETQEVFRPSHPEVIRELDEILEFINVSIGTMTMFMDKTWGIDKDNIHKWF